MTEPNLWEVPPIWAGQTVVVAGSGPSLTSEQLVLAKQNDAKIIVVNDAYRLMPWADILYACDAWWWRHNDFGAGFLGLKVCLSWNKCGRCALDRGIPKTEENLRPHYIDGYPIGNGIHQLAMTGTKGLEVEDRTAVRTGGNSGYQAINLAAHLGAKNIILVGFDMKSKDGKSHFFGEHEGRVSPPPFDGWFENFGSLVEPLKALKVNVINCTPDSALEMFPKAELEDIF